MDAEADSLPPDWRERLLRCDFELAREMVADFFRASNREAREQGGEAIYPDAFVFAWQAFDRGRDYDTAVRLLEDAPAMWHLFAESCPGGRIYFFRHAVRRDDQQ